VITAMNKIASACVAVHGRLIVLAALNEDSEIVTAIYTANGSSVQRDDWPEILLRPEFGCFKVA
jgi:hypothetical protein